MINISQSPQLNTISPSEQLKFSELEELPPLTNETRLVHLMRLVSDVLLNTKSSSNKVLEALNDMRRLLKFYPEVFVTTFDNLLEVFSHWLLHANPVLVRTCLRLLSEIFVKISDDDSLPKWIGKLVPRVMSRAISEVKIIKEEALLTMEHLVKNVFFPETIEILILHCENDKVKISDVSFEFLFKLLDTIDEISLFNFYEMINWSDVLHTAHNLHSVRKEAYEKKAYKIVDFMEKTFLKFYRFNFLEQILTQEDWEFQFNFGQMLFSRAKFQEIQWKKQIHKSNLESSRMSIKTDKSKGKSSIERKDDHLFNDENADFNRMQIRGQREQ